MLVHSILGSYSAGIVLDRRYAPAKYARSGDRFGSCQALSDLVSSAEVGRALRRSIKLFPAEAPMNAALAIAPAHAVNALAVAALLQIASRMEPCYRAPGRTVAHTLRPIARS